MHACVYVFVFLSNSIKLFFYDLYIVTVTAHDCRLRHVRVVCKVLHMGVTPQPILFLICVCATAYSLLMEDNPLETPECSFIDPVCKTHFPPSLQSKDCKGLSCTSRLFWFHSNLEGVTGVFPCRNCIACENSKKTNTFTSQTTGKLYSREVQQHICRSLLPFLKCPCAPLYWKIPYFGAQKCHTHKSFLLPRYSSFSVIIVILCHTTAY